MISPVPEATHERIREIILSIPSGRVMTYGDVAKAEGSIGPRYVGRVLSTDSYGLPWWRVVNATGRPAPGSEQRALENYRREGTPLVTAQGKEYRVDHRAAKWLAPS